MYQIEGLGELVKSRTGRPGRQPGWREVSPNVLYLGLTSLLTDVSSEMVSTVLPMYLVLYLHLTPLAFGVVDGMYQGAAALLRVASGLVADRFRRHKEVAAGGYALSAACKLGLLAAGATWSTIAAVVLLDRTGKGVRTAPRDALISLSSPPTGLATAFGVHRALDTAGALLGPLVAFALLASAPGAFDAVFVASFCVAVVGLGVLILFVENRPCGEVGGTGWGISPRAVVGLFGERRFRALALAGAALGLVTLSDGFIYLTLQRRLDLSPAVFPLLYVGAALVYLLLAVPTGRLADRLGRRRVFVGGYTLLLVVYAWLVLPPIGGAGLAACLLFLGAFYAATDGVLMALASAVLPPALRTTGLALLTTATSLARLLASVLFGAFWTWWGVEVAVGLFLAGLLATTLLTAVSLAATEKGHFHGSTP